MRTLDVTDTFAGIVVVNGFGDKYWDTAVYLNGKLVGQDRDAMEADNIGTKLSKALAKQLGLSWKERQTHIWWRQSFHDEAPKTLHKYDDVTIASYRAATEQQFLESLEGCYAPRSPDDEVQQVCPAYELSGGDPAKFEKWHQTWLATKLSFNDRFREEVDKRAILESRREALRYETNPDETVSADLKAQGAHLAKLFKNYLLEVYRAKKPLDPVARRAALGD